MGQNEKYHQKLLHSADKKCIILQLYPVLQVYVGSLVRLPLVYVIVFQL